MMVPPVDYKHNITIIILIVNARALGVWGGFTGKREVKRSVSGKQASGEGDCYLVGVLVGVPLGFAAAVRHFLNSSELTKISARISFWEALNFIFVKRGATSTNAGCAF